MKKIIREMENIINELECVAIPEQTVALSVVLDFFDEHHIADNLSMADVIKLEL